MNKIKMLLLILSVSGLVNLSTAAQNVTNPNPKAVDAMTNGDFRGAISILDREIRDNRNLFESYKLRSDIKRMIGDFVGSIKDLDKTIEIRPSEGNLYERRSGLRMMLGNQMDGALADLDTAIALGVKYEKVFANRAWIRFVRQDLDGAIVDYQAALAIRPDFVAGAIGVATVYERRGDKAKAIETLENFLAIFESMGQTSAVKSTATVSTSVPVPGLSDGKTMVGQQTVIYKDDSKTSDRPSRDQIDRMNDKLEQSKNTAQAFVTLARLYDKRGDSELALATVEKGIAIDPSDFYGYATRGVIKTSLHKYATAIVDLDLAIKAMPDDPGMYVDRGIAYLLSGKGAEAQKDFDQYLKLYPNGKANLDRRIAEASKQ